MKLHIRASSFIARGYIIHHAASTPFSAHCSEVGSNSQPCRQTRLTTPSDTAAVTASTPHRAGRRRRRRWPKLVGVDALMQLHHNIHTLRGEKIAGY